MNIKLIKAEIEKLSFMLSAWEQSEQVSAIERDIALDKLKKLYDAIRFDEEVESAPIVSVAPTTHTPIEELKEELEEESDENSDEKEVEVELIFADDEFPEEILLDDEEVESASATDILAATVASAFAAPIDIDAAKESAPEEEKEEIVEIATPVIEVAEPVVEVAPEPEPTPQPEPSPVPEPAETQKEEKSIELNPVAEEPAAEPKRQMNSLFNMEEVRRQPRSKHQRMMSIYSNNEPVQEKVVDISKIFNMDIDEPEEAKPAEPIAKPVEPATPKPIVHNIKPQPAVEEKPATLADAIPAPQTLADTIAAPTALAEEINNSRLRSLRDGIGINDKFLMIRDLFDGDGEAYDEAISALDELESMDDCMIHIIENYAWNPDSEGSKFIMQLLERKLS